MTREQALEQLARWREQIDAVDLAILKLLNQRTAIVEEIGRVKQSADLAVYEPKREDQVFRNVTGHNSGPLSNGAVQRVFERIIDEMRTIQKERMNQQG